MSFAEPASEVALGRQWPASSGPAHGAVASRLYPWFYAGLYLDEWFTRMTFRIWPAKLLTGGPLEQTGVSK